MKTFFKLSLTLALLGFTVMWMLSYFYYSAIGIDDDRIRSNDILHSYYRIHWPGDGMMWLGRGSVSRPLNSQKPLETLDLAGVLFRPPSTKPKPFPETHWNHLGFWHTTRPEPAPHFWLGMPAWVPALLLLFIAIIMKMLGRIFSSTLHSQR